MTKRKERMKSKRELRVVVTGSRDMPRHYEARLHGDLGHLIDKHPKRRVTVHAGDAQGVDDYAHLSADVHGIESKMHSADWKNAGRAAGPQRNKRMLQEAKPHYVLAYPSGASKGTRNTMAQAHKMGYKVYDRSEAKRLEHSRVRKDYAAPMTSLAELGEISKAGGFSRFTGRITGSSKRIARSKQALQAPAKAAAAPAAAAPAAKAPGNPLKENLGQRRRTSAQRAFGIGTAVGGTAAVGGAGYGGYRLATRNKRKEQE